MKRLLSIFLCGLAILPACGQDTFDEMIRVVYKHTVPVMHPQELLDSTKNIHLLDIRSKEEFDISHLPSARLISYKQFSKDSLNDIPRDASIVLYCSVGYRSERIGEQLLEMGFSNVKNLYGGIFNWKNKALTVVNNQGEATDSVHAYNKLWSQWLYKGTKVYE